MKDHQLETRETNVASKETRGRRKAEDLEDYLRQIPAPPREHVEELKMEKRLKRMLQFGSVKLSDEELQFYSRQIMLDEVGFDGQLKLKDARVCIVGLGGLGSTIAVQLAAMGIGHLRLVDRDIVEESNLQRQHLYDFDVIGFPKVEAATKRLERLNPYIKLEPTPLSINELNATEILRDVDVVVDGLDNMKARYIVNRACVKLSVPYVFGAAISTFGNTSTIIPQETACLACFYGKLKDRDLPSCATVGVHPSVLGIISSIEVAETIKIVLGKKPSLKNKLLYCDISSMQFEEIEIARLENCPVCGHQPETPAKPSKGVLVEESCGRNNKRVFIIIPRETIALDLEELASTLKAEANLKVEAKFGLTFAREEILASILTTGVMIIEGAQKKKNALKLYKQIMGKIGIS